MKRSFKVELHDAILRRNCGKKTEQAYMRVARKFFAFTGIGLTSCDESHVARFLTDMNRQGHQPAGRKQALNALVFIYKYVVKKPLGDIGAPARMKIRKAPVLVPTRPEVARIFAGMSGIPLLMARLMYGAGLRISEVCKLRVKDFDFENGVLLVYDAKGGKHRQTTLPKGLVPSILAHQRLRLAQHEVDLQNGAGYVELPGRYGQKVRSAPRDFAWQYFFSSARVVKGYRWYISARCVQEQFKRARYNAGIYKNLTPHNLRKAFATHLVQAGVDIRTVQDLLGHAKVETTQLYVGVLSVSCVTSPVDFSDGLLELEGVR